MFKRYRRQIGFKIVLGYTVLFTLSSAIAFAGIYVLLSRSLEKKDRDVVESTLSAYIALYEREGAKAIEEDLNAKQVGDQFLVRILDKKQNEVFLHIPLNWQRQSQVLSQQKLHESVFPDGWTIFDSHTEDDNIEVLSQHHNGSFVQVGISTDERNDVLERMTHVFFSILVPLLLLGAIGGILFSSSILQPIRRLIHVVHEVQAGNFEARTLPTNSGDELAELSALFNQMLDRIQALIGNIRETTDNVAHDLRTPLTRVKTIAELALKSPETKQLENALVECVESSEEILVMINTLLDISEVDAGVRRLQPQKIEAREIFQRVQDLYTYSAEDKGIVIECSCGTDLKIMVDKVRFTQAIANLVDNALKYSSKGALIRLTAYAGGEDIFLRISDTGPGIPAAELPKIWERLFRGDASRTERGFGLGLNLVRSIVIAHGATIDVESEIGKGSSFTIRIKRA